MAKAKKKQGSSNDKLSRYKRDVEMRLSFNLNNWKGDIDSSSSHTKERKEKDMVIYSANKSNTSVSVSSIKPGDIYRAYLGEKEEDYDGGEMKGNRPVIITAVINQRATFIAITSDNCATLCNIWELYISGYSIHDGWADVSNVMTKDVSILGDKIGSISQEKFKAIIDCISDYYQGILRFDDSKKYYVYDKPANERPAPENIDIAKLGGDYHIAALFRHLRISHLMISPTDADPETIVDHLEYFIDGSADRTAQIVAVSPSKEESIPEPIHLEQSQVNDINPNDEVEEIAFREKLGTLFGVSDGEFPCIVNISSERYFKIKDSNVQFKNSVEKAEYGLIENWRRSKDIFTKVLSGDENKIVQFLSDPVKNLQKIYHTNSYQIDAVRRFIRGYNERLNGRIPCTYNAVYGMAIDKAIQKFCIGEPEYRYIIDKKTNVIDSSIDKYINATSEQKKKIINLAKEISKATVTPSSPITLKIAAGAITDKEVLKQVSTVTLIPNLHGLKVYEMIERLSSDDIIALRGPNAINLCGKYGLNNEEKLNLTEAISKIGMSTSYFCLVKSMTIEERKDLFLLSTNKLVEKYKRSPATVYQIKSRTRLWINSGLFDNTGFEEVFKYSRLHKEKKINDVTLCSAT